MSARKSAKEVPPLVDIQHDYAAALKRTQDASELLYQCARNICQFRESGLNAKLMEMLREQVNAYRAAKYGDD